MVENRLHRPSGVYVFSSRTCVHARHVILMVLHVLYQVIISNQFIKCVMLCVMTACHAHFAIYSIYAHFAIFFFIIFF